MQTKIDGVDDDNDGIISITTNPAGQNNPYPHILHNSLNDKQVEEDNDDDDNNNNDDNDNDNRLVDEDATYDNANDGTAVVEDQDKEQQDPGVCRSKCNNKGVTKKYADYALMMNAQIQARGKKQAVIKDGFTFFLAVNLSNAKPVGTRSGACALLHECRPAEEIQGKG